ncbi:MAG TPA: hypothetical protein LFV92_05180 [Rickettsia endosymbiont of Ceroptres masudai]|nr:hypothetical protein [Rickettsia endosymbiont of Ceroptres masudai]
MKDIKQYLPESKYNLKGKYKDLVSSCNKWDKIYFQNMFGSENLKAVISDKNFQKICSIYKELQAENNENAVTEFLLDLVGLGQSEFIIPYAFITKEVPEAYSRINLGMLGVSKDLPDMIHLS